MLTDMPHKYGDYVVPYDMGPDGPPRGFIFDGDSWVLDLFLREAAKHDWAYFIGKSKWVADWEYVWGHLKKFCLVAPHRYLGLMLFGGRAYGAHKARLKAQGLETLLEERMVHYAAGDYWDWAHKDVQKSWLLKDLRRKV